MHLLHADLEKLGTDSEHSAAQMPDTDGIASLAELHPTKSRRAANKVPDSILK
jgi:hypothetical protein